MSIKRYDPNFQCSGDRAEGEMEECQDGDYVSIDDYRALVVDYKGLMAKCTEMSDGYLDAANSLIESNNKKEELTREIIQVVNDRREDIERCKDLYDEGVDALTSDKDKLTSALSGMLNMYVDLCDRGELHNDPDCEPEVIAARVALKL